jgi:hypothetical protein
MWHRFLEGGWAMYPIFGLGLLAAGAAGRFALRGEHQLLGFVRWLIAALLLMGVFGFSVGSIKVLHAAASRSDLTESARLLSIGFGEAANCLGAALMFSVITCVGAAVGQRRFPVPNPSAVAR